MQILQKLPRFQLALLIFLSNFSASNIDDYIYPKSSFPSFSNSGTIGLIQMPTARMLPAGSIAFSWSDSEPYQRGSFVGQPFSWLEASYQYTDVNNALYSLSEEFSGDQTYKDKSFDAKFLLFNETAILPAVAAGIRDMGGTGVFAAEYLVASKRIRNIDFTLGLGWGSFSDHGFRNPLIDLDSSFAVRDVSDNETQGGEFTTGYWYSGKVGVFGGAEIFLPNFKGTRVKIEYDSTDYELEGFPYGEESFNLAFDKVRQPSSKINLGLVYPLNDNLHLKLNYIKGHTISFGFSAQLNFGKKDPFIKKNDPPKKVPNPESFKRINANDKENLYKSSLLLMNPRGFPLRSAKLEGNTYKIVFSQSDHQSWPRASGRVLRILDDISPPEVEKFELGNINGGLGMYKLEVPRETFAKYMEENLYPLAAKDIKVENYDFDLENYEFKPTVKLPELFWKIVPTVKTQFGGPDGFFFGNLRLSLISELALISNVSIKSQISVGIANNFSNLKQNSDSVLPHVRTDIVEYLKEGQGLTINYLQIDKFYKPFKDVYAKTTAGFVENMFGAIGGEILYRPFHKNFAVGAELWRARQREYKMQFGFRDYETTTGHINFYYKEPKSQVIFALKGGRFLAEDSGFNFDFSRRFRSGLRMGVFFALTDISEYEFGEGSFDKGWYFFIPIESFFTNYSKGATGFGLRPLTRDGAAFLKHSHSLYGVTEQANYGNIVRDWDSLYE